MSSNITYDNSTLRRFKYKDSKSNKFWEIIKGEKPIAALYSNRKYILETRWGRIGNTPQTNIKDFPHNYERDVEYNNLAASKLAKGYKEVWGKPLLTPKIDKPILVVKTPAEIIEELNNNGYLEPPVLGKKPGVGISSPEEPIKKKHRADLLEITDD